MAKTSEGFAPDSNLYEKILYVSKERLDAVTKSLKSGKSIDKQTVDELMVPEDLPDKSILVPIDISVDAFGEVYEGHEELLDSIGAKGLAEAVIEAAKLFEVNKGNFKATELPIPMTVGEWKEQSAGDTDDEEDEDAEDADEGDGAEEGEEEEGEEEDAEEDEAEEPATKKRKAES